MKTGLKHGDNRAKPEHKHFFYILNDNQLISPSKSVFCVWVKKTVLSKQSKACTTLEQQTCLHLNDITGIFFKTAQTSVSSVSVIHSHSIKWSLALLRGTDFHIFPSTHVWNDLHPWLWPQCFIILMNCNHSFTHWEKKEKA